MMSLFRRVCEFIGTVWNVSRLLEARVAQVIGRALRLTEKPSVGALGSERSARTACFRSCSQGYLLVCIMVVLTRDNDVHTWGVLMR